MELAEALPNYLNEDEWTRCPCNLKASACDIDIANRNMRPPRPHRLENTDKIDRKELFNGLKGFCTYGSPLDKFATLWPAIVPINEDTEPLKCCTWVNVRDPIDPVAGELDQFRRWGAFVPNDVPYRSSPGFLLAHLAYLKPRGGPDGFAPRLGHWIVEGEFDPKVSGRFRVRKRLRAAGRYFWWTALPSLALAVLTIIKNWITEDCLLFFEGVCPKIEHTVAAIAEWMTRYWMEALCVLIE